MSCSVIFAPVGTESDLSPDHSTTNPPTQLSQMARSRIRTRPYSVKSVSRFVALLEKLFPDSDDAIFRGQRQDWPLLPKIARIALRPGTDLLGTEQRLLADFKLQAP